MVERVHRQIKDSLPAREAGAAWHSHLPWGPLGLRAAPKEDSSISSAELVLGAPLILLGKLLTVPEPAAMCEDPGPSRKRSYAEAATSPPAHLAQARYMYVRRGGCVPPLVPVYMAPFFCTVLQRHAKTFTLQVGTRTEVLAVDRLKAHTGPGPLYLYVAGLQPPHGSSLLHQVRRHVLQCARVPGEIQELAENQWWASIHLDVTERYFHRSRIK
jgi:hypothetical protein